MIKPSALVVIALYAGCLAVILFVSPKLLAPASGERPWWRIPRFWASLVALPFGLGSAVYLSEYARPRVRGILKPALEVLAGIPTVVFGFFALTFFTPLLQDLGLDVGTFNVLSAGIVIGALSYQVAMVLPSVTTEWSAPIWSSIVAPAIRQD